MASAQDPQHIESIVKLDTVCPKCGDTFTASSFAVHTSDVRQNGLPEGLPKRLHSVGTYALLAGALTCAVAAGISPHRYEMVRVLASGSVLSASVGAGIQLVARFGAAWLPR
jgi:hypothetical protein